MARVADVAGLLEVMGRRGFTVDPKRCVQVRNRNARCEACAEACVSGCITVENGQLDIRTERCIGCGSCATACPTGALVKTEPTDADIAAEIRAVCQRNAGVTVIACASVIQRAGSALDPESVVSVPCLGRVDEALLAGAASAGATRLVLVSDSCDACAYGKAAGLIESVVAGTSSLFAAWNVPCKVKVSTRFPKICAADAGAAYDAQRREFLSSMRTLAKDSGISAAGYLLDQDAKNAPAEPRAEHVTADGTLPHYASRRQAALRETMATWGEPMPDAVVDSRLWARLRIDAEACNGCAMCAVFCPSGALQKRKEVDEAASAKPLKLYRAPGNPKEGTEEAPRTVMKHHPGTSPSSSFATGELVSLVHTPGSCVACGTCAGLCPKHAISLSSAVPAADIANCSSVATPLKDIFREKGGPDAIKNSMSKLVNSAYIWG